MGEVWHARDTRLGRDVAIKFLPANFAADVDRLDRFEQEARATSGLNHPNILTVFDIGNHNGSAFIVAELLEGEELRDCLNRGRIPLRKTIDYAQQIMNGLSAAHGKGIVHRDLKPENLFITNDERVKILDFGIAKLETPASTNSDISEDATRKVLTDPGMVIGTVGYMSPEQVRGEKTDHRSDIFSFGAILHEMITGRRAFKRETHPETMAAILREEPEALSASNPNINPSLERIVNRCLDKKPDRRFQSTPDLAFALEALTAPTSGSGSHMTMAATAAVAEVKASVWRARIPWIALATVSLLAALALFLAFKNTRSGPEVRTVRFTMVHGQRTAGFGQMAVSPDGRNVVISSVVEGKSQLWIRPLDSLSARALPNTEGSAGFPFWSPDSRSIAFSIGGGSKLRRFDLADGTVQPICDIPFGDRRGFSGTWNRDGTIVFFSGGTGMYRVPATGGEPSPVPGLDQSSHQGIVRWPHFLPDGNHFLYLLTSPQQSNSEVFVTSLDGKDTKRLLTAQSNAIYATAPNGGGYLLFARNGALLAQPFDLGTLTLSDQPVRVADQVRVNTNNRGFFSASDTGTLVYDQFAEGDYRQLTWVDRARKQPESFSEKGAFIQVRLSPDKKSAAVSRRDPATSVFDLFVIDVARGATTRLTSGPSDVISFAWSPDGKYVAWAASARSQGYKLMRKLASGSGQEEVLLESNKQILPTSWSPDGKFILYTEVDANTRGDIWVLPLEGDRNPSVFFRSPGNETLAVFSPDGHWVAFESSESGTQEIYVQNFPSGGKTPVSNKGGRTPEWRGDGKELFYITPEGKMTAVEIKLGGTVEPAVPKELFDVVTAGALPTARYDVTADGQRFLILKGQVDPNPSSLTVVLNWTEDLNK